MILHSKNYFYLCGDIYDMKFIQNSIKMVRVLGHSTSMKRKIEDVLSRWNEKEKPLPLMLLGARQTGKTYILEDFCKRNFTHYVHLNFFENADFFSFFKVHLTPKPF